eukprot:TRINITY_DN8183_c0_g1_i1.p1 TRINITY_DN8183_c0_g1~~TRINITY_DN8183_c0_g1_i1.p1  ORF type:complete len:703 (-),score=209.09 TRINITY_DN8183_c0_g1_i1:44-2104(-)
MDNDQKLVTLLDSLGEGTDVDFAREVLEAHAWDLEAALNTLTGGAGGAAQSSSGAHLLDAEGYRAPMRTGYSDRLLGPEPGSTPWELAFAAAQGDEGSRQPVPHTGADGLEQALHASRSEHQRRMDVHEQGALAEAFQASWSNYEEEELRRRSQQLQAQSEEQKALARAIEDSYREQAGSDNTYRTELERALELSSAQASGAAADSGVDRELQLALQLSAKDAQQAASSTSSSSSSSRKVSSSSRFSVGRSDLQPSAPLAVGRSDAQTSQAAAPRSRKPAESPTGSGNSEPVQRAAAPRLRKPAESLCSPGSSELLQRAGAATAASASTLPERKISSMSTSTVASRLTVGKLGAAASRQGTTAFPQSAAIPPGVPSSSSREAAVPAPAAAAPAARTKVAMPTSAAPLRPASRGSAAGTIAGSAAAVVRADRQRGAAGGAPGQTAATLEALEADLARRRAEEKERSLRRPVPEAAAPAASVAAAAPAVPAAEEPAPAPAAVISSRAEALAAAESRRRSAAEAAQAEERLKVLEPFPPIATPSPPVEVAEASPPATVEATSSVAKAAPGDKEAVAQALVALRRQHLQARPAELLLCMRTLRAYVGNLASKPHEAKFQRISKDNAAFSSRVACLEGATDVLMACGFAEQPEAWEIDPAYMKKKGPALFDALAKIDVMVDQVQSKVSSAA